MRKQLTGAVKVSNYICVRTLCENLLWALVSRISIEYRITKTRATTLANHKGHRQSNEPIKTQSKQMYLTKSAGKRVWRSQDWFWFYSVIGWKSGAGQEPINNQCVSTLEWKPLWQSRETHVLLVGVWWDPSSYLKSNNNPCCLKRQHQSTAPCTRPMPTPRGAGHLKRTRSDSPFEPKKTLYEGRSLTINLTSRSIVNYGIEGTWSNPLHRY